MRRIAVTIATLLGALLLYVPPAAAADLQPAAEAQFLVLINEARAAGGAAPLAPNAELTEIARAWSAEMDRVADLSHNPSYREQYTGEARGMAENVGHMRWPGGDVEQMVTSLHDLFLSSPGHFRNLMGASYNQVGIGVVTSGDHLWVTVNFLEGPLPAPLPELAAAPDAMAAATPRHHGRR